MSDLTSIDERVRNYLNLVSPISPDTWKEVAGLLKEEPLDKGDFFAMAGRMEHQFGIVLDGVLRAYITNGEGSEYTKTFFTPIHFTTPISFIGAFTSLVSHSVNQVNIQALTTASLLVGNYRDWLILIDKNKEVADWSRRLAELFFIGKEQREFEYFTTYADVRYKLFRERYPELENLISQYHIAQFLGISPTQLSRVRKKIFMES